MASATLTKPPPPPPSQQQQHQQQHQQQQQHSSQPLNSQSQPNTHRLSVSSSSQGPVAESNQGALSARHPLPASSATVNSKVSLDHPNSFASMSQQPPPPQFSSQHSFGMSQPSSQPARPTGYHQFANSQPTNMEDDDLPQIYSVCSGLSKIYPVCPKSLANLSLLVGV
jgi:hypothetical protein